MKFISFCLLFYSLCFTHCDTQKKDTIKITEKFDIETFNKNKVNNEFNFVLDDGTKIRQYESGNSFTEIITPTKPELFQTQKEFYKNGKLHLKFISFERNFIKSKEEYNKVGKLIEEIDYDPPYQFTFEQLLELLKKQKDSIDIFDINTNIARGFNGMDWHGKIDKNYTWYIKWKKTFGRRETLKVDGITGEVLERSFFPYGR